MTPLDLRLKYKSETGNNPTYGSYDHGWGRNAHFDNETKTWFSYDYKGSLTPEYAQWLEELNFGDKWKREIYYKERGQYGTYEVQKSTRYRKCETIYTREYKEWLEEIHMYRYVYSPDTKRVFKFTKEDLI